jgi:hypothetical protein
MTSVDGGSEAGGECSESGAWSDDVSSDACCGEETESGDGAVKQCTAEEKAEAEKARIRKRKRADYIAQWRKKNPDKQKAINDKQYMTHKYEIRTSQNARYAEQKASREGRVGGAGGGAASGLHFGVLPGCRGMCSPAMCSACFAARRAGRHPVRQMCNEAHVIEAQEEKPLPVDAQEEAAFRARLAASLCAAGCRVLETDLRKPTCEFWGTCRRCHAVEHRKRDLFSAQGAFYAAHREEVDESHRLSHAKWKEWLNSWIGSGGGSEAGAAQRAAIMQELASLITARS